MKDYLVYRFQCEPRLPLCDILVSELAEYGFESFVDTESGVEAYIPLEGPLSEDERKARIAWLTEQYGHLGNVTWREEFIAGQNWNARWEASYPQVRIGNNCLVRAPFHDPDPEVDLDILIQAQMSFGTGHHATTYLMLEALLDQTLEDLSILDMGCGTGVLAIASAKMGAASVVAVDIEANAVNNTLENAALNGVSLTANLGEANSLAENAYDGILANINKNVLINDMAHYSQAMRSGAFLLLSGFFDGDREEVRARANDCGLIFDKDAQRQGWALVKCMKPEL